MWIQMPGANQGVKAWHDQRDRRRRKGIIDFLKQSHTRLRSGDDTTAIRETIVRRAAALALPNDRVRQRAVNEIFSRVYRRPPVRDWRTFTPRELIEEIWSTIEYAFWDPEEYMHPWPEPRSKYVC